MFEFEMYRMSPTVSVKEVFWLSPCISSVVSVNCLHLSSHSTNPVLVRISADSAMSKRRFLQLGSKALDQHLLEHTHRFKRLT